MGLLLGSIAGRLLSIFSKRRPDPTAEDFERADFKTSTQRLGLRFTDRIRNVFRFKWIKRI
jgi:hypothetical protein